MISVYKLTEFNLDLIYIDTIFEEGESIFKEYLEKFNFFEWERK